MPTSGSHDRSRFGPYVAALATDLASSAPNTGITRRRGSLASVDLSGFTRLSERLAIADVTGAEEINAALNLQFGPLIDIALRHGGDILQFGGDALLIWFEGDHHAVRAGSAGVTMQRSIRNHGRVVTSAGVVRLRMSVGVATGEFTFALIGETHRELLVLGLNATRTVELESRSDAGQVLICEQTAAALPGLTEALGDGAWKLRRGVAVDDRPAPAADGTHAYEFVPPEMRAIVDADVTTAEHRPVTVAFVLVPGTDRLATPGHETELLELLGRVAAVADRSVREFGVCWSATDIAPDGFKLLFFAGAPIASEDDAGRVLRTAEAFVADCGDTGVRVGVNTGLAFAADIGHPQRRSFAIIGDTVNLAARLMGKAPAGSALVAPSTVSTSRSSWLTDAPVQLTVKGKKAPVSALPLIGQTTQAAIQATTPLVGRDREFSTLVDLLSEAPAGAAIEVIGPGGIGKTNLVSHLADEARRTGLPVDHIAASVFGAHPGYGALAHVLEPDAPTMAVADETDPDRLVAQRDRRHADTVLRLIESRTPRLLVVEDVQWLDESSQALLMQLLAARQALGWMIVFTRRPGSCDLPYDRSIELAGLALRDLLAIAPPEPGTGWLESDLAKLAADVGGNPLYFAEGVRLRPGDQRLGSSRSGELLAERLDRLHPRARRTARVLALIGRPVPTSIIADVAGEDPARLTPEQFDGVLVSTGGHWWFASEPMVEVARAGLARRDRRTAHARTASWFTNERDRLGIGTSELATHYAGAEQHAETWRWARVAATEARAAGAIREATAMLRLAMHGVEEAPSDEVEPTVIELGELLIALGNFDEADELLRTTWKRVGRDQPPPRAMLVRARSAEQSGRFVAAARRLTRVRRDPASTELDRVDEALLSGLVSYRQGRRRAALTDCRRGLLGARRLGDDRRRAQAHLQLEMIRWTEGHRHAAWHESCAELLFRRTDDPRGLGYLLLNRGVNRLNQGPWDLALHDCFEAQSVLDGAGYLIDGAIAEMNAGVVLTRQGRPEETVARAERIAMVFNGLGWPEGVAYLDVSVGAALAQQGRVEDALAQLRRAEAVFVAKKNGEFIGEARRQQAVSLLYARRPEQALEALEGIDPEWFDLDPVLEVGVLWLRGHAALQLGDDDPGRAHLEHALALADERLLPYDRAMIAWSLELQAERATDVVQAQQRRALRTELFTALGVNDSLPPLPL